jgi:hypothetical protein
VGRLADLVEGRRLGRPGVARAGSCGAGLASRVPEVGEQQQIRLKQGARLTGASNQAEDGWGEEAGVAEQIRWR